jgi:hypothetical protein
MLNPIIVSLSKKQVTGFSFKSQRLHSTLSYQSPNALDEIQATRIDRG